MGTQVRFIPDNERYCAAEIAWAKTLDAEQRFGWGSVRQREASREFNAAYDRLTDREKQILDRETSRRLGKAVFG